MDNFDLLIENVVNNYINENIWDESKKNTHDHSSYIEPNKDLASFKKEEGHKKKHKFRSKAIKKKGGTRVDFDEKDDETYNKQIGDDEQDSIEDILDNGYINIKAVAQDLYPDHTPEGAQSQLRKKLAGETADSGYKYHLKDKELKRLRHIISQHLRK